MLTALVSELHPDSLMIFEWYVSQVGFNVQVLSSLINSGSEYTIQQQKTVHDGIFESKCSHVFRCVFGFEKTVDVFESIIV